MSRMLGVALGAVLTLAAASFSADAPPPPDPASAGDWLAFCSIRLPPDLSPEARAAWSSALGSTLDHAAALVYPEGDPARTLLRSALAEAVTGVAVDLVVPAPTQRPGEPAAISGLLRIEAKAASPAGRRVWPSSDEWPAHRTKSSGALPASSPAAAVELAINLNGLRACGLFSPAFDPADPSGGRAARILDALGLDNARVVGLHVRLVPAERVPTLDPSLPRPATPPAPYAGPPLLVIDATWSARSEPPGAVHRLLLTTDHWPRAQFGGDALFGRAAAVAAVRLSWRARVEAALRFAAGWLPPGEIPAFERERSARLTSAKANLDRLCSALDPWVALSLDAGVADLAQLRIRVPLRSDAPAPRAAADFDALLAGLAEGKGGGGGATGPHKWSVGQPADTPGIGGWWIRSADWTLTVPAPGTGGRAVVEARIQLTPAAQPR